MILNEDPTSVPALSTLQIQLTAIGKLVISLQTVVQPGLSRLWNPSDPTGKLSNIQPGSDLWLSPNGSIARLVSIDVDSPAPLSPGSSSDREDAKDDSESMLMARRKEWKSHVIDWLARFGLPVDYIENEPWIQVEICGPFYVRLTGEAAHRQGERVHSSLPLNHILWPARYCFARTAANLLTPPYGSSEFQSYGCPLEFAENWYAAASSKDEGSLSGALSSYEEKRQPEQSSGPGPSLSHVGTHGEIESLSRAVQYPDLQSASSMYPTPPDGPATVGLNSGSLDTFTEDPFPSAPQADNQNEQKPGPTPLSEERSGPIGGLAVGSGMYDVNDDDDLFGEMNNKEFKGISDEDFSFFDSPGLEAFENGSRTEEGREAEQPGTRSEEDAQRASPAEEKFPPADTAKPADSGSSPTKHPDEAKQPDEMLDSQREQVNSTSKPPSPYRAANQTISPPLSPLGVKRILFSGKEKSGSDGNRKQWDYDPVAFNQNSAEWNQKYGTAGKFWFSTVNAPDVRGSSNFVGDIPLIGLPQRGRKVKSSIDKPFNLVNEDNGTVPDGMATTRSRSTSTSSDESDEVELEPDTTVVRNLKRKRSVSHASDSLVSPSEKPAATADPSRTTPKTTENSIFLGNFFSMFSDWSLMGYFSIPQSQLSPALPEKEEQVGVAQLLVSQTTQSSLDHKLDGQISLSDFEKDSFSPTTFLEDGDFMADIERLDLRDYALLQESFIQEVAASEAVHPDSSSAKDVRKGSIWKLDPPHLRIRRGDDYLDVLPPAISFWETFGLEPAHTTKNISAFCIHPHNAVEPVEAFLERLGLLYSNCGLGEHTRGSTSTMFEHGLGSWDISVPGPSGYASVLQSLKALCQNLGMSNDQSECFVLYTNIAKEFRSHRVSRLKAMWSCI